MWLNGFEFCELVCHDLLNDDGLAQYVDDGLDNDDHDGFDDHGYDAFGDHGHANK